MRFLSWAAKSALPFVAAASVPSVAVAAELARERERRRREERLRAANRHRERAAKVAEMDLFSDEEFKRQYRMSRASFNALLELLKPLITKNEEMARRSSGSGICPKARLALTLRWLAGGSYLDIAKAYGVDQANFFHKYGPLWDTMEALDEVLDLNFSLVPTDLARDAQDFANVCGQYGCGGDAMPGCVMAIDGWVMMTRQPKVKEVGAEAVRSYWNRKETFGLVVMAGCDARARFKMFSVMSSGSCHDSIALEFSSWKKDVLDKDLLPPEYYIIGDEAFKTTQQLLTPWSGTGLSEAKDSFNYHLSRMRCTIERSFGLMTKRFGIFWRPLQCKYERWSTVAVVCAKLHNWCLDHNEELVDRWEEDRREGDAWRVLMNDAEEGGDGTNRRGRIGSNDRRQAFTDEMARQGLTRPGHSRHSRAVGSAVGSTDSEASADDV